ncbi:acyl-[ACP]--phospholipid O-acyltransferase [Prosthecomicrobium hirschii]|uniref:acyl-[ACP]--phospholipid O-acyltransferase n=1 Tax=Prosthecodimorpha hirschii TaxID=665126 RepID=UPI0022205AF6|nr:acyl-[ACP]--phospholipid O-acyltransferase [Prosthecomicrobium hirschii]MCW1841457.1 acyl-[ACP]--phospholipid O-acyltransferase [Prosthecomicrobium hirschii]
MSRPLILQRRFAPLFVCQFFSALNDNFLKNALVFLILYHVSEAWSGALVALAGAVLVAPYFFLSGLAGEIADRYDKARVAERVKFLEIFVALIAVIGFALHSIVILFVALGGFGVIAALFGPVKYGILPDHLVESELPGGNALIESATFIAILTGTVIAGVAAAGGGDPATLSGLMMVFALISWGAARMIPPAGEAAPCLEIEPNVMVSTRGLIRDLKADARLWWLGLVTSWFWLIGAVVLSLLPPMVKSVIGGSESVVTAFLAIFSIAIALGSGLASFLSSQRIVLLPTPVGAVLMGLFSLDLAFALWGVKATGAPVGAVEVFTSARGLHIGIDLFGLAIAGGLFIVPSFSALQAWAGKDRRARVIGASNVLSGAFIAVGSISTAILLALGLGVAGVFAVLGLATLAVGVVIFRTLPTSPFRDLLSIVYRGIFRLEVRGLENVAKAGPRRIIALNHVSFLDAGLALSLLDQEPVFAIDSGIAQRWWVKPFLKITRAMPLDPTKPMQTRTLIHAVRNGETLIIFPEGRLTVTGSLMKVYDGAGLIADKADAMVVPVRIEGLEQTPFTRLKPHQIRRRLFPKVRVTILEPVKLDVDPALKGKMRRLASGAALYQIMSDLVYRTTAIDRTVFRALVDAARHEGPGRIALDDPLSGPLSYRKFLAGARVIGQRLMPLAAPGAHVGVMLPNANAAAVATIGLMSAGRVPAMINFSAGPTNILAACRAAVIETVVTSRGFIEKGRLQPIVDALDGQGIRLVYLEDIRATVGLTDRLTALWHWQTPLASRGPDDPAAILFTSGSEGMPKGVVLSSRNMLANAAQAAARIDFGRTDKVFNVLPLFHSFGLTVGLILPLVSGVPVYLYPSPLHYRIVPELVYGSNATIFFGTDTFLTGYARSAHPYDFRSLRYVVAGAEPVKETTRRVWMERFGLRILEGYGVTEAAPVVAINTPMFNRFGTVGRLLPGLRHKLEPVPGVTEGGRLLLRGPNIMLGYLRAEAPGVLEPPPEGWYDTGDIVVIDRDGFVTIKGRAKRFAKVGGEMISLAAVETLASELWPDAMTAVVAEPDPRKGERLVMVTTARGATRAAFQAFAKSRGAAELMAPSEVVVVDKLPVLGSGKVDFVGVAKLVRERTPAPAEIVVAAAGTVPDGGSETGAADRAAAGSGGSPAAGDTTPVASDGASTVPPGTLPAA